jgi:hypothetical protein
VSSRTLGGATQYFVKWIAFPDSENSWEPEDALPQSVVDRFKATTRSKKKSSKPTPPIAIESVAAIVINRDKNRMDYTVRLEDGSVEVITGQELAERNRSLFDMVFKNFRK